MSQFTPEFWAIIGVGLLVATMLEKTNRHLDETNRRLQKFWEEWVSPTRRH